MLSALLNFVVSVGVLAVLAGAIAAVVFLVDSALIWGTTVRSSLETASEPEGPGPPLLTTTVNGTVIAADRAISPRLEAKRRTGPRAARARAGRARAARTARPGAAAGAAGAVGVLDEKNYAEISAKDLERETDTDPQPELEPDEQSGLEPELDHKLDLGLESGLGPVAGVRQLMERLVETLVSGGLDDVALRPKHPHPEYQRVYKRHQPRLRSALTSLAYSLQMALSHKPLSECETPGRAHAQLRAIVLDLARDVAALEQAGTTPASAPAGDGLEASNDFASKAYEDILATAIVNKVMERSSSRSNKKLYINNNNNNNNKNSNNNNFISSLEVRVGSVDDSADSMSSWTESWTSSGRVDQETSSTLFMDNGLDPEGSEHGTDPLSLMIEECIEEVTTITASSSPSSTSPSTSADECSDEAAPVSGAWDRARGRRARRRRRRRSTVQSTPTAPASGPPSILAGISFQNKRVPFPELGVDIVDADWPLELDASQSEAESGESDWQEDDGPRSARSARSAHPASCLELITPLQSWEDNWLFQTRRQRKPDAQYSHHPVPVPMLVPNPSEDFRALIGDVDAEETSDLSECSDEVLEEVVLSGSQHDSSQLHPDLHPELRPEQQLDPRSLNVSALEGLAETCNLELLKRAAATPVTKEKHSSPSAAPARRTPAPERSSSIADKDAAFTVLYDTPTRRELPASPPRTHIPRREPPASAPRTIPRKEPSASPPRTHIPRREPSASPPRTHIPRREPSASPPRTNIPRRESPASPPRATSPMGNALVDNNLNSPPPVRDTEQLGDAIDNSHRDDRNALNLSELREKRKQEDEHKEGETADPLRARLSESDNLADMPFDLATPPRPGTIAEREHRKWLEARPLPNNPYSPENIERRLRERASNAGPVLPATPGVNTHPSRTPALQIALRVDPDPKKYGRDFYINPRRPSDLPPIPADLKNQYSTPFVENGFELDWTPVPAAVRTNGDGGSEESPPPAPASAPAASSARAEGPQTAPSVKELAKQFLNQPHLEEQNNSKPISKNASGQTQHKVVIIPKDSSAEQAGSNKERKAVRQVHSLTARSMSKEFREGLRHLTGSPVTGAVRVQPSQRPDPEGARQPTDSES